MITGQPIQFEAAGYSDIGNGRTRNEDAFLIDIRHGLFVVADGLGGHPGGDVAAQAVIQYLPRLLRRRLKSGQVATSIAIKNALLDLNAAVRLSGQRNPELRGIGSTAACLMITDKNATIAHMGDSRIYHFRDGELSCLTQDHSVTAMLLRGGEISVSSVARHPARGQLTRYIGMEQEINPDVLSVRVKQGDRFLLCTDGLWNVLSSKRMTKLLSVGASSEAICWVLIEAAKAARSQDNITCVVVEIKNIVTAKKTCSKPHG